MTLYAIKPLEFKRHDDGYYSADSVFGEFELIYYHARPVDERWCLRLEYVSGETKTSIPLSRHKWSRYAEAAAETYYRDRLASALVPLHAAELVKARRRIEEAEAEITRLKEGNFTPEEFQNLCHNMPSTATREAFVEGCRKYQDALFGSLAPPQESEAAR